VSPGSRSLALIEVVDDVDTTTPARAGLHEHHLEARKPLEHGRPSPTASASAADSATIRYEDALLGRGVAAGEVVELRVHPDVAADREIASWMAANAGCSGSSQ